MPLPNFLVIAAAKAGTTAVYDYLRQHPQIYMSPLKETNIFALEGQEVCFHGLGDDETIKIYLYDRFDGNSISVLQDIFRFLGVEDTFVPDGSCRPNVSRPPDPPFGQLGAPYPDGPTATRRSIMSPEVRRHLVELFRPDIVQLEELCGQDLSVWLDASSLPVEQAG